VRAFLIGFRFQLRLVPKYPEYLHVFVTTPAFTAIFAAMITHSGHLELAANAVVAPTLVAVWSMTLVAAGDMIARDREEGTLETVVTAPVSFVLLTTGRICAVELVGLVAMAEAWLVVWVLVGVAVPVADPVAFALTVTATALAAAGTAGILAGTVVLSRTPRTLQSSLSTPVYLLAGVLMPVSVLPGWLHPLSRVLFLSWSADLLRESVRQPSVPGLAMRLTVVLVLGLLGYLVTLVLLRHVLVRVRVRATLGYQ
jgi:ABC-2 type transport system permease protein